MVLTLILLAELALHSPWGRMMRAIRDNETAAEAMGIHMRIVGRTVGDVSGGLADRKPRMAPPPQAADRSRLVQS